MGVAVQGERPRARVAHLPFPPPRDVDGAHERQRNLAFGQILADLADGRQTWRFDYELTAIQQRPFI